MQRIVVERIDSDAAIYAKYLKMMLPEGQKVIGGDVIIVCRACDIQHFADHTTKPTLDDSERGMIVESSDGKIQIDLTLRRRVDLVLHDRQA